MYNFGQSTMNRSFLKVILTFIGAGLFAISYSSVAYATARPTCQEMGFNNNANYCDGRAKAKCPWNLDFMSCEATYATPHLPSNTTETVNCDNRDCAALGYTRTAEQCANYNALKCPFDDTKFFCGGTSCIEDGYTTNPTCPNGEEIASTQNCPTDSNYKKVTCRPTCDSQGYTLTEATCKETYQTCQSCSSNSSKWKGSGTQYSTKTCAKGDVLFSNKKCYYGNNAPTYQSKLAIVFSLSSDGPGKLAMGLTETSNTVSPTYGSCTPKRHWIYSGDVNTRWGLIKADLIIDRTYTCNPSNNCTGDHLTFQDNNSAAIRSSNSSCTYTCNGGYLPTIGDWYYYKQHPQDASKFTSNGGTAPNMSTNNTALYWVSNIGPFKYSSNYYLGIQESRYRVQPGAISSSSPVFDGCTHDGDYGCGSNCPNNSNAHCAKVRCVYTF